MSASFVEGTVYASAPHHPIASTPPATAAAVAEGMRFTLPSAASW
jgi:hypothetical protein